ncbi:hypothetical protein [Commensalibacter papalotli (ex Botero et al. 2024)]|uniref:Lysophospholipase L1 or related esterase. Includes spore coat protein LipC/YcsK (TesA) (PDB:1BWP) n=1 Tax=Commensalibacter papalotli (ex Botero et al. 2024) TaxID=2972766 RepID=A0ABM9HL16_9PROT|nr:hypothetical protein [Commensalibacter papalotli (ex Botero et al. 2024)]CAI3932739.1 Lysophospholipase L1 or related esterase. Includes spore coat protein LipC/YcsK (TesA) (PDB:1BWP) [Commensalibacter papalotli (ex Botero et al. 2024)]CAI3945972.1 Lysophospholipase L1 or related esterase. Includes spore coat protein LipC/YcsK (TesA) (PDB:1BWP) [Commensalibacter papalotli (ex Botero et al. 2024)]
MSCNLRPVIVILPSGCLGNKVIELPCKSPIEEIFYNFSVVNRMKATDSIINIVGQPSDQKMTIDEITFTGKTFRCCIGGGSLNTKTGIRFLIMTKENEVIEFVCTLTVMSEGIISQEQEDKIVLGDTGPAGTITIGKVSTVSPDQPAVVTNVGIPSAAILNIDIPHGEEGVTPTIIAGTTTTLSAGQDAKVTAVTSGTTTQFNFALPQGFKGDAGSWWYSGIKAPDETVGLEDKRGMPRPGDMYLLLDNDGHNASTYIFTNDNKWEGPLATVAGPQGAPGKDGLTPTIAIGKIETLNSDLEATAEIITDGNNNNILNLGLVKGKQGITPTIQVGTVSTISDDQLAAVTATTNQTTTTFDFSIPQGKQGVSFINDGTVDAKVKSIVSDDGLIQSDGNGNLTFYKNQTNSTGEVSLVTAFKITPKGNVIDDNNLYSILSIVDEKFTIDCEGNIYSKGGIFVDNGNIISGGEGTLKLQALEVGQVNNSGKSGSISLRDGKTTNQSDASISVLDGSGEKDKFDSGTIRLSSKEVNIVGLLSFGVSGSKIKNNGAAELSCIELGNNSTGAGYIDFHTTYLNEDGKANDYDARVSVDNISGLNGKGNLSIIAELVRASSNLTVGKNLIAVGTASLDNDKIQTDGKGNISISGSISAASGYCKIAGNGSLNARCIELGGNGMEAGYIDFHTTYLNADGKANDYDVRVIVDNTSGLTSPGMGRLRVIGDITATKSLNIGDSLSIKNQLTVGGLFQAQGYSQFDNNTIFTDGKGKMSFYDQTNKKTKIYMSYNDGINVQEGLPLTLSNYTSDGSIKSARLRYTGTLTDNIVSIDSTDGTGAMIACNKIKANRSISTYNDNTYTRLCPVIYDASVAIGSDNGLPNTVTTGYVVACKNLMVNGKVSQDILFVRANKDYPAVLTDWDVIGVSTLGLKIDDLQDGHMELKVKTIISQLPLTTDISTTDLKPRMQAWNEAQNMPCWWDGDHWNGTISSSKSSDTFTYIGSGFLLLSRGNSYVQPAWVAVNEGALPPKTSMGEGYQFWNNSESLWVSPTDGVLHLDYNISFNDNSGTGVDGTIFQEHDELWVCVCKKTNPAIWLPSSLVKHSLKPYSILKSDNKTVYKPSDILNGSLSYPVKAGDQLQIKIAWFPKQLFTSSDWSQRIQISEGRFSFYVS